MNEDSTSNPDPQSSPGVRASQLSGALEELLDGRCTSQFADRAKERAKDQFKDQTKDRFKDQAFALPERGIASGSGLPGLGSNAGKTASLPPELSPCPRPEEWAMLLESDPSDTARVDALLVHAGGCRPCAQRLRLLSADLSADESALLAQLNCATAEGRHDLAARLAATARGQSPEELPRLHAPRRSARFYGWIGIGIAAALLLAVGIGVWRRTFNSPERLLAEAYGRQRLFDLRMPGAAFAAVTPNSHLRGATASREPAALRDARNRLDHQLQAAPEDPHLLQLEARADILEEKFDPAIDILERLVAAGPITARLLADDAAAYFQRGLATESDSDRNTALDYLRRADELAPGDSVVLFNEAIAMEDRGQTINAVETWNRYLRIERDPRWQEEGRRRLQSLEEKLNQIQRR